jgi:hypothetical protein
VQHIAMSTKDIITTVRIGLCVNIQTTFWSRKEFSDKL